MDCEPAMELGVQPDVYVRAMAAGGAKIGVSRELSRAEVLHLLRELDRVIDLIQGLD